MERIFNIADYFLFLQDYDCEDHISYCKLQNLCYCAQGINLATTGKRLFDNDIYEWTYGANIHALYERYKGKVRGVLPINRDFSMKDVSQDTAQLLNEVYSEYGQYVGFTLGMIVRESVPWLNAVRSKDHIIKDKDMIIHFKKSI